MSYLKLICTLFAIAITTKFTSAQSNVDFENQLNITFRNQTFLGLKSVVFDRNVSSFIGIPYAEPPIGELRFKKSLPAKTYGLVNATQWRSCCPQVRNCRTSAFNTSTQSEDCLYLNIWTPTHNINESLLPVMLYIHGGSWLFGESPDGSMLSATGDVVVVTINYRVGFLGFLYADNEDAPGNAGLWDQVLALEWVNKNIEHFGGDPQRITLFGQSVGGRSISIHMLSPLTRNLFKNAIMMSGSALSHLSHSEPSVVFNTSLVFSKLVGCNTENQTHFTSDMIECVRNITIKQIIDGQISRDLWTQIFGFSSNYIHGDQILPKHPNDLLKSGDYKRNITLMISTTDEEGSWILNRMDQIRYSDDFPVNLTHNEAYEELKQLANSMRTSPPVDGEKVAKLYFQNRNMSENSSSYELLRTIAVAIGDFFVTCPTIKFAKTIFNATDDSNRFYQLYWASKLGDYCGEWQGACHASDSAAIFGRPFLQQSSALEKQVARNLMSLYAYFAKHDRPPNEEEWLEFHVSNGSKITPYYEITGNGGVYGTNLKVNECEGLWNNYF